MSLELDLEDLTNITRREKYDWPEDLCARLKEERSRLQELEDMDFDDCAGGACKL